MPDILNISCYKFVPLPDAQQLRELLAERAAQWALKGTVLLAEEGINFFLAGSAEAVHGWVNALRTDARFADVAPKESWSSTVPFRKMRVVVKPEIIRMDYPAIRPAHGRAPAVKPADLQRWLAQGHDDAGRPVVTLDTRNDYEVDEGAFTGAIDWRIRKFTEFPAQLRAHKADLAGKTVVSYCTGGIRCEKAAILMQDEGIENVYQLEGGILKYFEETDGTGYQGSCFVFDERRVVDDSLQKTELKAQI
ncbi:sulfurtransferase [Comamonas testosteroni]